MTFPGEEFCDRLRKRFNLPDYIRLVTYVDVGYGDPTVMQNIIDDKTLDASQGIIHHREGVDLLPSNIELSGLEVRLINAMSLSLIHIW